jgi:hypothetical protein
MGLILRLQPEIVETKEAMGLKASTTGSRTAPHPTQNRITAAIAAAISIRVAEDAETTESAQAEPDCTR